MMNDKLKEAIDRTTRDLMSYEGPLPGGPRILTSDLRLILGEITRLRAELERVREAGRAVVQCYSTGDMAGFRRAFTALDAAIKEGGA